MQLSVKQQEKLLKVCIDEGLDLHTELSKVGLDYDDLLYRYNDPTNVLLSPQEIFRNYLTLDDVTLPKNDIPVVSFFSGAGGLDLGFEASGFTHIASIEINEIFCETLRNNRSAWMVLGPPEHSGDISNKEEYSHLLRQKVGITPPFDGVFHGGPPCQSFSIAANQRFAKGDQNFKRVGFSHERYGNLLFDFIWYIREFLPRAFVIENVPGLADLDGGEQVRQAIVDLIEAGYRVTTPIVLNAAQYGVPQKRLRLILTGVRNDSKQVSLPIPETQVVPCFRAFEKEIDGLTNHLTRQHKADSVLRYMNLRCGERDGLGRVDRLHPAHASKTVIAGGMKGGGRSHLHPFIPRTLSVRECARLQTFPDNYVFQGPVARQFTQVGNAVPPLLAARIANQLYESVYR